MDGTYIDWKKSIDKMHKNGLYKILEDSSVVREFDFPIPGKTKDQIYDYALNVYRTTCYSRKPDRIVYDWTKEKSSFIDKESEIRYIDRSRGIIEWTYRSYPTNRIFMGVSTIRVSSKSIINWSVEDGNIHVTEKILYLNSDKLSKLKAFFYPVEVFPFGLWRHNLYRTSGPGLQSTFSETILCCYIADCIALTQIKQNIENDETLTKLVDGFKFRLQPNGDFLTEDGMTFHVETFEGQSANDLYNKFRTAITLLYKSAKENISYVEDRVISINASAQRDFFWKEPFNATLNYVLKFQFKDEKVRIEAPVITNLFKTSNEEESLFKETAKEVNLYVNDEPFLVEIINALNVLVNNIVDINIAKVRELDSAADEDW